MQTREWLQTKRIKGSRDILPLRMAQIHALDFLEGRTNADELKRNFANLTGLASLAYSIFGKSNWTGFALGLISFVAAKPDTSLRNMLIKLIKQGNLQIQQYEARLLGLGNFHYNAEIDVEMSFIRAGSTHWTETYFQVVTAVGAILAYYDGSGNKIPKP